MPGDWLGILGFFVFFWFSRWFLLAFVGHALVSFGFFGFPDGFGLMSEGIYILKGFTEFVCVRDMEQG